MMHHDPFGYQPDDYDPEFPELRDDPHCGLYLLVLALMCAVFWVALGRSLGWI